MPPDVFRTRPMNRRITRKPFPVSGRGVIFWELLPMDLSYKSIRRLYHDSV